MKKNSLYSKITEILVLTQFDVWVEKENLNPTAEWIKNKKQRAIDYYLGKTKNPLEIIPYEQVKFRRLVELQVGLIMREV